MPKNNWDFWERKLRRSRERDAENTHRLEAEGWRVLRLWEHEIETSPADCARRIAAMLGKTEKSDAVQVRCKQPASVPSDTQFTVQTRAPGTRVNTGGSCERHLSQKQRTESAESGKTAETGVSVLMPPFA